MGKINFKKLLQGSTLSDALAFWKLDDLTDLTGNGNTLTINGGITFGSGRIGNAAIFSGSGDYLSMILQDNTTTFSFSVWVYLNAWANHHDNLTFLYCDQGQSCLAIQSDGDIYVGPNSGWTSYSPSPAGLNQWMHLVITYGSNTTKIYFNGTIVDTVSGETSLGNSLIEFGTRDDGYLDGKLDAVGFWPRILTETEIAFLYNDGDGTESVLTTPVSTGKFRFLSAGSSDPYFDNVSLLLNLNSDFTDSSNNGLTVTPNGDVSISTSEKKFGAGSAYFDGSYDYLEIINNGLFDFETGNFTVEFWMNPSGFVSEVYNFFSGSWQFGYVTNESGYFYMYNHNTASIYAFDQVPLTFGTWYHVAYVRSGNTISCFVNGSFSGSVEYTESITFGATVCVGIARDSTPNSCMYGYIDEVRITKGIARYTSNFSVPTHEFGVGEGGSAGKIRFLAIEQPSDFITDGLLAFWKLDNVADSSGNGYTLTNNNSVTFEPGKIGNAAVFDKTNSLTSSLVVSGPFTISVWIKTTYTVHANNLFTGDYPQGPNDLYFMTYNGYLYLGGALTGQIGGSNYVGDGNWHHIVLVWKDDLSVIVWLDGEPVMSASASSTVSNLEVNVGSGRATANEKFDGSIDAFGVWSRALDDVEIAKLYNLGGGLEP